MYGPYPDRYPAIMYDLSAVGISAAQIATKLAKLSSGIVQIEWKELPKQPDFKTKGDKRNGTMSRQQAFGGLARKRGNKWK